MRIGLIIGLALMGFFLFGPFGALGGVIIGCFAGLNYTNKTSETGDPFLDSAMSKIKAEGDARKAANRAKKPD